MAQFAQTPGQTGGFLQQLLAPEVAMPMAAALMGNQGNAANFGNAFGAYGQAVAQRAGQNKTLEYFRQNAPEFAAMVEAGMPVSDAWQTYTKQRYAQKAGPTYGLTPIYGTDEQGNTVLGTLGNDGSFKRIDTGDFRVSTGVDKVDLGTHYGLVDKRTGATVGTLPKENFQEAYDKGAGSEAGKLSVEMPQKRNKAMLNLELLDQQRSVVEDDINRAIAEIQANPGLATGLVGGLTKALPGTPAYQLARKLETIKANVGFDKLQAMREASPTGGALGQVSDFENRQLQSVFGNLEQAQSAEEIIYNLQRLQQILSQSKDARRQAFARDFGGLGDQMGAQQPMTAPAAPGAPASSGNRTRSGISWSVEP